VVWQNLMPAFQDAALPENASAQSSLKNALAALALDVPTGTFTSPRSSDVTGRRYAIAQNTQNISSVAFDFSTEPPTLTFEEPGSRPEDRRLYVCSVITNWVRERPRSSS
jgi:hypothetical protein